VWAPEAVLPPAALHLPYVSTMRRGAVFGFTILQGRLGLAANS
jgi:hypothetical protein